MFFAKFFFDFRVSFALHFYQFRSRYLYLILRTKAWRTLFPRTQISSFFCYTTFGEGLLFVQPISLCGVL